MIHVLFVCLGNVCRSPMAEAMFKQLVHERSLDDQILVRSCGTSDEEAGNRPNPGTLKILKQHHLSDRGLIAIQIQPSDFKWANYILTMDRQNFVDLQNMASVEDRPKIHMCLDSIDGQFHQPIPDPWYTHRFGDTYEMLQLSLPKWLNQMVAAKEKS